MVTSDTPKTGKRAPVALLFLLFAAVLFGAVFYYVGGVSGVMSMLGGASPTPSGAGSNSASAAASVSISADAREASELTYAEQIESQEIIDRLADGDVTSFVVDEVNGGKDSALVRITARFRDGTRAPGDMRFIRRGEVWYFVTITGLRPADTGGIADDVNTQESIEPLVTSKEKLAEVGVVEPDEGVVRTIAQQQVVNQPVIRDLLAGEYTKYRLGKPVLGSNTFTIPVTVSGSEETTVAARIIVIAKNVEGKDRLFITTFSQD